MATKYHEFVALSVRGKSLIVHFTEGLGTAKRLRIMAIPVEQLLEDDITEALDTAIRRRLIETWSGVDIADPLF